MKKKRGYHEKVIQKRAINREEEAQSGEPVAGGSEGNQEDLNEEELQVWNVIDKFENKAKLNRLWFVVLKVIHDENMSYICKFLSYCYAHMQMN